MTDLVEVLADALRHHGVDLLLGSSVVLVGFTLMVLSCRSLSGKHRLAGTAIVAIAAYALVALVPLPRLTMPSDQLDTPRVPVPAVATDAAAPIDGQQPPPVPMVAPPFSLPQSLTDELTDPPGAIAAVAEHTLQPSTEVGEADVAWWLSCLLLVGASLFTAQLLIGWLRLRRILRASRPASMLLQRLVELPKGTRLFISTLPGQPFCCGLLRSTIVLPRGLAQPTQATRFVLLHEREHLRSGDARMRAIAALLRPLLFWHPLFWWLQQQLRFTGELLADDAAAEGTVADYVRSMMALAAESTPSPTGTLVATVFHRRSELFRRLEMMLQRETVLSRSLSPWQRRLRAMSAIALVTLSAATFGVEPARAQEPTQQQNLREEIDRLRATIRDLKAELQAMRPKADAAPPIAAAPTDPMVPDMAPSGPAAVAFAGASASEPGTAARIYVVKQGDTIGRIARVELGSANRAVELEELNPDVDGARLRIGQRLILPNDRSRATETPGPSAPPGQPPASMRLAPGSRIGSQPVSFSESNLLQSQSGDESLPGLAGLVTRCIELRGEIEIQKVECEYALAAARAGEAGEREVKIAEIRLRTKQSQYEAVASMLKAELDQAEAELSRSKQLAKNGFISKEEVRASESRVKLLHNALR